MSEIEHEVVARTPYKYGLRIDCKCGEHWAMNPKATEEDIQSILKSHIAYAKRIATRVD